MNDLSWRDFTRKSVTHPGEAARLLLTLRLGTLALVQAILALALVSVILRYLLLDFIIANTAQDLTVGEYFVLADIFMQLVGIITAIFIILGAVRVFGMTRGFAPVATIYVWYNLLVSVASLGILATFYLFGALVVILSAAVAIWALWAMAHFWSALLGRDNLLAGLGLGVASLLLSSSVTVYLANVLGLPVMGILQNV